MSAAINKIPSICEISPSYDIATTNNDTPIMIGIHLLTVILLIRRGVNIAEIPITIPTLLTLLPTMFPRINSVCELKAASREAASSGVEVPYATTVKPIIILLIRSFFARETPPETIAYPPIHKRTKPASTLPISSISTTTMPRYLV